MDALKTRLHPGDRLPNFSLQSTLGPPLSLDALAGKPLALFFFLKEDSGGCAVEVCRFRDLYFEFRDAGLNVVGVCGSSIASLARFANDNQLPFPLLSDLELTLMTSCGIVRDIDGDTAVHGRVTFLADAKLRVVRVYEDVDVSIHALEVLADAHVLSF